MPVLSVVIPLFNESGNVDALFARLGTVLHDLGVTYEIICVDDGSRDDTVARVLAHHRRDPRIKLVELSRNFGKELALTAGLHHTAGEAVVMIDADLQHPPELIAEMLEKWREGWEMVVATRRSRDTESLAKRLNARAFYWLFDKFCEVSIRPDAGDFRLLDRKVVDVLNSLPEHTRFMKGLYSWVGFRQCFIPYDVAERGEGSSKFNLFRLWRLAMDGLTSFTTLPLHVWVIVGSLAAGVGLLYGLFLIVKTMILGIDVPGYASIMVATLFLGGVQLLIMGIMGEYLGRVFTEVKNRPLYVVRQVHKAGEPPAASAVVPKDAEESRHGPSPAETGRFPAEV